MFIYKYYFNITLFIALTVFNASCCLADVTSGICMSAGYNNEALIPFYPKVNYDFGQKANNVKWYKAVTVIDGDTIIVSDDNGNKMPVRLINIDCDETHPIYRAYKQAYESKRTIECVIESGIAAKKYLEKLIKIKPNKYVQVQFFGKDKYGRNLGIVYKENQNLNNEMLKSGMCAVYEYNAK